MAEKRHPSGIKAMLTVDLITGFLGSGKTTFLLKYANHLLRRGVKLCVLEYDHGAVNVDMLLLQELRSSGCGLEMVSAACDADCLRRRLSTKLLSIALQGYDRVVMEPSGVFDVDEFFDILREPPLEDRCEIGSVIDILSAEPEENMSDAESYLMASQAAVAGRIVLSRTQLVTAADTERTLCLLDEALRNIRSRRDIRSAVLAKDWDTLTDEDYDFLSRGGYELPDYVKRFCPEEDFDSVVFLEPVLTRVRAESFANTLFTDPAFGHVLRIKGFFTEDGRWYRLNAVPGSMELKEIPSAHGALIVIGTGLRGAAIRARLAAP